jgi:hypothetical protein
VEITSNVFSGEFLRLSVSHSCFATLMRLFYYLDHFDDFCDLGGLLFGTGWPVNSAWSAQGPKFEQIQLQYNVVAISEIQPKRYTNSCVIFSGI